MVEMYTRPDLCIKVLERLPLCQGKVRTLCWILLMSLVFCLGILEIIASISDLESLNADGDYLSTFSE